VLFFGVLANQNLRRSTSQVPAASRLLHFRHVRKSPSPQLLWTAAPSRALCAKNLHLQIVTAVSPLYSAFTKNCRASYPSPSIFASLLASTQRLRFSPPPTSLSPHFLFPFFSHSCALFCAFFAFSCNVQDPTSLLSQSITHSLHNPQCRGRRLRSSSHKSPVTSSLCFPTKFGKLKMRGYSFV